MPDIDPIVQFAARRLGGRTMPDDLRKLLSLQLLDAASGRANRLKDAGVIFLSGDRPPALIEAECRGRDDLSGVARLAHAQAMADMVRYSGFVAEDSDGNAIGYWFGPDQIPIEAAPLMRFFATDDFSILRGKGIAEAALVIASHGDDRIFAELREYFNAHGLKISAQTIADVEQPKCSPSPQATYRQLIKAYSADMSTTSAPDAGDPVDIMTTHRGGDLP